MELQIPAGKRIIIVAGHYGSGKTEFSVSLAHYIAASGTCPYPRIALCDLDVVNPYFRSRERTEELSSLGIRVCGGMYGIGTTAEIPELSAEVRAPLEDEGCLTIVDLGGNDSGARILRQFKKYFTGPDTALFMVVNGSRPDTAAAEGVLAHIESISTELGLPVTALVSNTHLLTCTEPGHIIKGAELCGEVSKKTGVPILCACYPEKYVKAEDIAHLPCPIFPLGLHMRETWLDR